MSIRLIRINDPGIPASDRSIMWPDMDDHHLKMRTDEGKLVYLSGITGVVPVNKVVQDAALESPGNELPVEGPSDRYLILTNGQDGARAAGWGSISEAEPSMLLERVKTNFEWQIKHVISDGPGKFLVYDTSDESLWVQTQSEWRKISGGSLKVPGISNGGNLVVGALNRVSSLNDLTMPLATYNKGQKVLIKYVDNNGLGPTIYPSGSDLIEFSGSFTINEPYMYLEFISDGNNWLKIRG